MSWIFNTIINNLYKNKNILYDDLCCIKKHNFIFDKTYKTNISHVEYKDRMYKCTKCKTQIILYRSLNKKAYFGIESRVIFYNKTCNQIIMEKACV